MSGEQLPDIVANPNLFAEHVARVLLQRLQRGEIDTGSWEWDGWRFPSGALNGQTRDAVLRVGAFDITIREHKPNKADASSDLWDWLYGITVECEGRQIATATTDSPKGDLARLVAQVATVAEARNLSDRQELFRELG